MRRAVEIKWFRECSTLEQAKQLYKTLVMLHHPDRGGDLRDMQEINAEMDFIRKSPSVLGDKGPGDPWRSRRDAQGAGGGEPPKGKARTWDDFESEVALGPGKYTMVITGVRENSDKKYVALVFDIAEGRHKGHFEFEPWYRHCIYLSYGKDWQIKNTREVIGKINGSNHGFDGDFAFCNNQTWKFNGKRIGVYLSRKYLDGDGFINPGEVFEV